MFLTAPPNALAIVGLCLWFVNPALLDKPVGKAVKFDPIKCDALGADADFCQMRPGLGVENVAAHAEVSRRRTHAN